MIRAGRPFVPPGCPRQHGNEIDITTAEFHFSTHTFRPTPNSSIERLEVLIHFEGPNSRNSQRTLVNMVDASTDFSLNSRLAAFSRQVEDSTELREQLRQILLERIATCHGVVNNECWALGDGVGLGEAITALYHKTQTS